jgi:arylsulfatase A-like enzyme
MLSLLFIICDDLAWGDIARHGNPHLRTPNLDRLHDQSVRLTHYCSGPVCTPARVSLFTGRYPFRTRAIDTWLGRSMMDPGEVTLAELFRARSYATGISGKWHLGDCYPMRAMDKGFAESLVFNGGGLRQPGNWFDDSYFDPELLHNGNVIRTRGYCTDVITNHAIEFIGAQQQRPYFSYVGYNAPHTPYEASDHWSKHYESLGIPTPTARAYGMIENIDYNVGRLMETLAQSGRDRNTIVVFTSDHGAGDPKDRSRFNAGLRDWKGTVFQGGLRVPCFVRVPGVAPRDDAQVSNPIDWLPTFAATCGLELPRDRALDGVDLRLADATAQRSARQVFIQWQRGNAPIIRQNIAVIEDRYKLARPGGGPTMLFDLESDPGETTDLSMREPARVEQMLAAYDQWFEQVSHERDDNFAPPRIEVEPAKQSHVVLTQQDWRVGDDPAIAWNIKHPGHWLLRSAGERVATVRVEATWQQIGHRLSLRVGDWSHSTELTAEHTEITEVPFPRGDFELHATTERGGVVQGVHFVHLFLESYGQEDQGGGG